MGSTKKGKNKLRAEKKNLQTRIHSVGEVQTSGNPKTYKFQKKNIIFEMKQRHQPMRKKLSFNIERNCLLPSGQLPFLFIVIIKWIVV